MSSMIKPCQRGPMKLIFQRLQLFFGVGLKRWFQPEQCSKPRLVGLYKG